MSWTQLIVIKKTEVMIIIVPCRNVSLTVRTNMHWCEQLRTICEE